MGPSINPFIQIVYNKYFFGLELGVGWGDGLHLKICLGCIEIYISKKDKDAPWIELINL